MGDDQDKPILAELERRIALFEADQPVGDCMESSSRINRQLAQWLAGGVLAWVGLALIAR